MAGDVPSLGERFPVKSYTPPFYLLILLTVLSLLAFALVDIVSPSSKLTYLLLAKC